MESTCPVCKKPYDGVVCTQCTVTDLDMGGLMQSEGLQLKSEDASDNATAFLVDLVSNRKIPITAPRCKVGRDDLNDIVISGDQSISRFHFVITRENAQYLVQDGKSRHGTFLNGNQITAPEPIHDGDVLKVGVSLFWFVIENAVSAAPSEKFAPVDVESLDQQELEFVVPEPAAASAPMSRDEKRVAAKDATREMQIPAELRESSPKVPESTKGADKSQPEPAKSAGKADAADKPDENAEITVAMLLDPFQQKKEAPKKSEPEKSSAVEPAEKASTSKADEPASKTGGSASDVDSTYQNLDAVASKSNAAEDSSQPEPSPAVAQEPKKFTEFDDSYSEKAGFNDYRYGIGESLMLDPLNNVNESLLPEGDKPEPTKSHSEQQPPSEVKEEPKAEATAEPDKADAAEESKSAPLTLGKFAEIIGEVSSSSDKKAEEPVSSSSLKLNFQSSSEKVDSDESKREDEVRSDSSGTNGEEQTSNGAKVMNMVKESSTVPDWCKKYFSSELNSLSKELTELNEQVRLAQQKIKEVESRVALTKGLRNTLLTAQGEELVEACGKVLTMLGWRVKISEEDKHELRLDTADDKNVSIARIVRTETQADRTHLGQLSISQTRYWCEQGVEPKGILIICKATDSPPTSSSNDAHSELAEYASKKNVCLMTTLQLLSVYKEIALHDGSADTVRSTVLSSSGWLPGFNLEPGSEVSEKEESTGTNKLSSLLSA